MKLVSYNKDEQDQLALLHDGLLYDVDLLHPDLPVSMGMFLNYWEDVIGVTTAINTKLEEGIISRKQGFAYDQAVILPPVPHPTSSRNAFACHQPLLSFPPFCFTNHHGFQGAGEISCMPDQLNALDFELQIAIVICKEGKNIPAAKADEYIGGFMIMNNICPRNLKPGESSPDAFSTLGNGFTKPIGPMLVTPDELEQYKIEGKENHIGNVYGLALKCYINDDLVAETNLSCMLWTFAEIIQQSSYGVQLFPGDIISSGVLDMGSFLQLNAGGGNGARWLKEGDVIKIEAEGLGILVNTIVSDITNVSDVNDAGEEEQIAF